MSIRRFRPFAAAPTLALTLLVGVSASPGFASPPDNRRSRDANSEAASIAAALEQSSGAFSQLAQSFPLSPSRQSTSLLVSPKVSLAPRTSAPGSAGMRVSRSPIVTGDGAPPSTLTSDYTDTNNGSLETDSGNININGFTLTYTGSGNFNVTGLISDSVGTGKLVKNGNGVLTLSAANSFASTTQILTGTVAVGDTNGLALQNSTVEIDTTNGLNLNGKVSVTIGGLSGLGSLALGSTTLTVRGGGSNTYLGALSGAGNLIKTDIGSLSLTNATNSIGGFAQFNNGTTLIDGSNSSQYGSFTVGNQAYVAYNASDTGTLAVIGSNGGNNASTLSTGSRALTIGYGGSGTMNLNIGGQANSSGGYIGYLAGSKGVVNVFGNDGNLFASTWNTNSQTLYVGYNGTGTLNITGGGKVSSGAGILGYNTGASGTVKVSGSGNGNASTWNTNGQSLYIGFGANGTLDVLPGGVVNAGAGTTVLGFSSGSAATLIVNGGSLTTAQMQGSNTIPPIVKITNPTSGYALTLGDNTNNALNFTITDAAANDGGGGLGGAGGINKIGTGTLGIIASETYTGATQISAGTLMIGNGGTVGSLVGPIIDNASLLFNRANSLTYAGAITGTGNMTMGGTGSLFLTSASSNMSGSVYFNQGTTYIEAPASSYASFTTGSAVLGNSASDNGVVTVYGSDGNGHASTFSNLYGLTVGYNGTGTLYVSGGGQVLVPNGVTSLGTSAGSTGVVNVSGTDGLGLFSLLNTSAIHVGENGSGTLNVSSGGQLISADSTIGYNSQGTGVVTISGNDGAGHASLWNLSGGTLILGAIAGSKGILNINSGAKVTNGGVTTLAASQGTTANLNINGGSFTTSSLKKGSGNTPTVTLTNPTVANGGGYALTIGNSTGTDSTLNFAIADAAGGPGGIDKVGSSMLTLSAANTFSGATQVDGGVITVADTNGLALQNSTAILNTNNGITASIFTNITLGGLSGSGNLALDRSGLTVGGNNASTTYSGALNLYVSSGGGFSNPFAKEGTGTLTLNNTSDHVYGYADFDNGTTLITGASPSTYSVFTSDRGTYISTNANLSAIMTVSGTDGQGHSSTLNSQGQGIYVGSSGTGTLNILGGAAVNASTVSIGQLTNVTGILNVSGADANGVASQLTIASDALFVGLNGPGTVNATNGGKVTGVETTYLSYYSTGSSFLNLNGGSLTTDTIQAGPGNAPIVSLTNPTVANGGGYALNIGGNNGDSNVNFSIADAAGGPGGIRKTGTGTLTLSAPNTFSGGMQIDGGVVKILDTNGLALQNTTVYINVNDGLDVTGLRFATIGGLSGAGNLALGDDELSVGANNTSTTYSGAISAFVGGGGYNGNFNKIGTGTLTLTNPGSNINSYAFFDQGTTTITGANSSSYASFTSQHGTFIGLDSGLATVNVVGTDGNGHPSSLISSASQGVYVSDGDSGTLNITGGGYVNVSEVEVAYLAGYTGIVNVTGGDGNGLFSTLNSQYSFDVGIRGTGTINATGGATLTSGGGRIGYDYSGNGTGIGTVNVSGSDGHGHFSIWNAGGQEVDLGFDGKGTLNITNGGQVTNVGTTALSADSGSSSTLNINGGKLTTDDISVGAGNTPTIQLTNPTAPNGGGYALTVGNSIGTNSVVGTAIGDAAGGAGGIDKIGTNTLTLGGTNTFSGGLQIDGGEIVVGADYNLGNGAVVLNGGKLQWNGSSETLARTVTLGSAATGSGFDIPNAATNLTVGSLFSGSGSLTKIGAGTLTLTAANTFSGATTVSAGTLRLGNGNTTNGAVAGNIVDNSALVFANPTAQAYNSAISGSGSLSKTSSGTLTLTGANSYAGGTTISGGTLVARNSVLGTGNVTVGSSGTLAVGEAANATLAPLSVGTLTVDSLNLAAATLQPELTFNLGASGISDELFITTMGNSPFAASGNFEIGFGSATGKSLGAGTYTLMSFTGQTTTANLPALSSYHAVATGNLVDINAPNNPFSYATNGNTVSLLFNLTGADAAPEPSALGLLVGPGLGMLGLWRKTRRK